MKNKLNTIYYLMSSYNSLLIYSALVLDCELQDVPYLLYKLRNHKIRKMT